MATNFPTLPSYDIDFWKEWSPKELAHQMAPIQWIKNKNKRETYANHVKFSHSETAKARETVPCKLDMPYGEHEKEKFDIFGVNLSSYAPTLFFVHGGYWRTGDRDWSGYFVRSAYSWGVRSVVISYPLAPEATMYNMCNSVCEALRKAMQIFGDSVFIIIGHSAGSQVASTIFHDIPGINKLPENLMERIGGAFLISGAIDMRPIIGLPLINKYLQMTPDQMEDFSQLLTVDKINPGFVKNRNCLKFLMVNAENDPPALTRQSLMYADMLRKKQFTAEQWLSNDDDHYTIVENMADENSNIAKKLKHFVLTIDAARKKSKI